MIEVDARVEAEGWEAALGDDPVAWAERALRRIGQSRTPFASADPDQPGRTPQGLVSVLFADDAEMQALNRAWRGKDKATDVLSFPAPEGFGSLGDIALGLQTVQADAAAQGKAFADHALHLLAHGFLHLLGYDHMSAAEAAVMEAREKELLSLFGVADPYGDD